jgi:hypothetical protein
MPNPEPAAPHVPERPYQIVSIEQADPPPEAEGQSWHCYVISQGDNLIQGYRQGNLKVVTAAVEEIVVQLNARRLGKRGRVQLVPTPRKRAGS